MLIGVGVDQDRALCILLHTIRATYSLMHSGKSSPNSCRNNQYAYPSLKLWFMREAECPSFSEQSYWRYDSFVLHPSGMYRKPSSSSSFFVNVQHSFTKLIRTTVLCWLTLFPTRFVGLRWNQAWEDSVDSKQTCSLQAWAAFGMHDHISWLSPSAKN